MTDVSTVYSSKTRLSFFLGGGGLLRQQLGWSFQRKADGSTKNVAYNEGTPT